MRIASLDFNLLALFFFITFVLAALSSALKTLGSIFFASSDFFSAISARNSFTDFLYVSFFFKLRACRRTFCLSAFFADCVIGIFNEN